MKKIALLFSIFFPVFSAFSQKELILKNGKITKFKAFENDSLDFFTIDNNSRLFKALKGTVNLSPSGDYFDKLSHDKTGNILNFTPVAVRNTSLVQKPCDPVKEKGDSKKYSFEEIKKCFAMIKKLNLDWKNRGSCDERAFEVFRELRKQHYITLRTIAMVSDSMKRCYGTKNDTLPMWLYHVANAMYCNDNQYYVLDLYLDPNAPIALSDWKERIVFGEKDCERFELYVNNCRVKNHSTDSNSYIWTVECSCDPLTLKEVIDNPDH